MLTYNLLQLYLPSHTLRISPHRHTFRIHPAHAYVPNDFPRNPRQQRHPGQIIVEGREEALQTAQEWRRRPGDRVWADGSRLDSEKVGAAYVWRTASGWTGRLYHRKEVFGAESYAICQALRALDRRQENGHR